MHFSGRLAAIFTFAVTGLLVYLVGTALLAAWPMWAMMGFGPAWSVALAVVVVGGLIWALGRGGGRTYDQPRGAAERCPRCAATIDPDDLLCPECHTALRSTCPECRHSIKASWSRCPYCEASTTEAPSATVRTPRAARYTDGNSGSMERW